MRNVIIIAACLIGCPLLCHAQKQKFNPALSMSDISFSAGMYANVKGEVLSEGTIYSIDYGEFDLNGFGFRGGISYLEELDDNINAVLLPLKFVWRTPFPGRLTAVERLQLAAMSQIGNYQPNIGSAIFSQLSPRLEINVGLSPGYISDRGHYIQAYSAGNGDYYDGISIKRRFMLTADAGGSLLIRIWRFNLVFDGQYHYLITNNYNRNSTLASFDGKLSRSYFSLSLGLNYML